MKTRQKSAVSGICIDVEALRRRRRAISDDRRGYSLESLIENPFEAGHDWDDDDSLAVISDWAYRRRRR